MGMVIQFINNIKESMERNAKFKSKVYNWTIVGLFHITLTSQNGTKLISMSNSVQVSEHSNTYSNISSKVAIVQLQYYTLMSMAMKFHKKSMRLQIILTHDMYLPLKEYGTFLNSKCIIDIQQFSDFKFIFQISKLSPSAMIQTWSHC